LDWSFNSLTTFFTSNCLQALSFLWKKIDFGQFLQFFLIFVIFETPVRQRKSRERHRFLRRNSNFWNFLRENYQIFGSRSVFIRFWWFLHKNVLQLKPEWSCFKFQVPIESFSRRKRRRQFRSNIWLKVSCYQSCFKSSILLPSFSPWKELSKAWFAIVVGLTVKKL
jgi:hypothetical protein